MPLMETVSVVVVNAYLYFCHKCRLREGSSFFWCV